MNKIHCPNCGRENDPHNTLCSSCGQKIFRIPTNKDCYCINCGAKNSQGSSFCYFCDFDFSKIPNLTPGQGNKYIPQETIDDNKKIFLCIKTHLFYLALL